MVSTKDPMSWRDELRQILAKKTHEQQEKEMKKLRNRRTFLIPDASGRMSKEDIEAGLTELKKMFHD